MRCRGHNALSSVVKLHRPAKLTARSLKDALGDSSASLMVLRESIQLGPSLIHKKSQPVGWLIVALSVLNKIYMA